MGGETWELCFSGTILIPVLCPHTHVFGFSPGWLASPRRTEGNAESSWPQVATKGPPRKSLFPARYGTEWLCVCMYRLEFVPD